MEIRDEKTKKEFIRLVGRNGKMQATLSTPLSIKAYSTNFVGEVHDINLSAALSSDTYTELKKAFGFFGILIFRNQNLTPPEFSRFSSNFGPLHIHHLAEKTFPENPEVRVISNVKKNGKYIGQYRAGQYWHTDLIYLKQVGRATILHGVECPPIGADTLYTDMRRAYKEMPKNLRDQIDGKFQVQDHAYTYSKIYPERPPMTEKEVAAVPPVKHPMVCIHPESKQKSVYMSLATTRTIGDLDEVETSQLLRKLEKFCTQNKFLYKHKWRNGDVIMWDNFCCMHAATTFDEKYDRILYRTQTLHEGPIYRPKSSQ
jgi:taurine dioxygenase